MEKRQRRIIGLIIGAVTILGVTIVTGLDSVKMAPSSDAFLWGFLIVWQLLNLACVVFNGEEVLKIVLSKPFTIPKALFKKSGGWLFLSWAGVGAGLTIIAGYFLLVPIAGSIYALIKKI